MNLADWFDRGMKPEEYTNRMKTFQDETMDIYSKFRVPEGDEELLNKWKKENLRVIALTEDWCGDAMLNNPILLRIAEKAGMEVRMLLRDENLELMDQYLTNGTSRAIPIYIFINEDGKERAVWGPRADEVQRFVDEERSKLPPTDSPGFPDRQKEMYGRLTAQYSEDPAVWQQVYESIKSRLMA